jgi:hypothetical protein
MKKLILVFSLIIIVISCKKAETDNEPNYLNNTAPSYNSTPVSNETYSNGSSNSYSYDVNGTDDDVNCVSGTIDVNGKYGYGTIEDDDGNEVDVDVEWTGKGSLEATDSDGNSYELEVD